MNQHTPGPWRAVEKPSSHAVEAACGSVIARTYCSNKTGNGPYSQQFAEAEANAQLIAAAPDMLAALMRISEHAKEFGDIEDFERQVFRMTEIANEAIAALEVRRD